jgi:hypothetical protein
MANMNIRTPKFYTDIINFLMATGTEQDGNFDVVGDSSVNFIDTFISGSEAELFDMRPMNQVTFDTSSTTAIRGKHVLININKQSTNFKTDFIAILNHNMASAEAKVRVAFGDALDDINDVDLSSRDNGLSNVVGVLNSGASPSGSILTPASNGSTIFTFDETDEQFIGIQFEGAGGGNLFNATNNLKIGCIIVGEHYTMPNAPDLSVKRSIIYDGVSVKQSIGGQKFANATQLGRRHINTLNKSPFLTTTYESGVYGGRIAYDLNFSYLNSSEIMPTTYGIEVEASDTVIADVWNRTKGNLFPFIFSIDSTSTDETDYIFARFGQNQLDMTQVAPDVFNMSLKIEEEF